METCTTCQNSYNADDMYFCYVCSKRICSNCVQFITLPQDTKASICASCLERYKQEQSKANEPMMEAMVNAALNGHDLGEWIPVKTGWQANCRKCSKSVWVGSEGVIYSLLNAPCPER